MNIGPRRLEEIRRSLVLADDHSARRVTARSTMRPSGRFASLRHRLVRGLSKELEAEATNSARAGSPPSMQPSVGTEN